ncbi:MAG: YibE/F family protein [Erysipelotrichaceae bacterium]|nr:YibE/F family protein [Erysipelotrichaceae bacterium]
MDKEKIIQSLKDWFKNEKWSFVVLAAAAVLFVFMRMNVRTEVPDTAGLSDYAEYERATVTEILSDNSETDDASDGSWRGEQSLTMQIDSGQYKGETLLVNNYIGPLYGTPLKKGDSAVIIINTYASGDLRATVYEYNRMPALAGILILFFIITALVGGKTGIKSLIALAVTVAVLFGILIPWLLQGASTLPAVFVSCVYITVVSLTLIGGVHRKTVCAMLGTAAGTALAMLFGVIAQSMTRINGLRTADVEPLLQLRQSGIPIGLTGLLSAGIMIAALGAVMDVAMSISSSLEEIHNANPSMSAKQLFSSGMNIGQDMTGTMTNTLILAFLGSGFTLILYLFSLGLSFNQLFSSAYVSVEAVSSISSSIGMILAIPFTAAISSYMLTHEK